MFVKSFGCQMNVYDSQRMTDLAVGRRLSRDGRNRRRRPRRVQYLPYPRAGVGKTLFRTRQGARNQAGAGGGRESDQARRRRLRRAGRRRRNPAPAERGRCRRRPAELSSPAGAAACARARRRHRFRGRGQIRRTAGAFSRGHARARGQRLRHRAGRLRQVLRLLRRALHARRRSFAAGGEDLGRDRAAGGGGRARVHADRPERQRLSRRRRRRPGRAFARGGGACRASRGCAIRPRIPTTWTRS